MEEFTFTALHRDPWNKGKLVGQKAPPQAQGHLGDPGSIAAFRPHPGLGVVRSGQRLQYGRWPANSGRSAWCSNGLATGYRLCQCDVRHLPS